MQSDEGILQNFMDSKIPEGWTDLTAGKIVHIESCYFRIVNVNIDAQEMILKPIPSKEAVEQLNKTAQERFKHLCDELPQIESR